MAMDVRIYFTEEQSLVIENVGEELTWENLFDMLYDAEKINQEQYRDAMNHSSFTERVGPRFPLEANLSNSPDSTGNTKPSFQIGGDPKQRTPMTIGEVTRKKPELHAKEKDKLIPSKKAINFDTTQNKKQPENSLPPMPVTKNQKLYSLNGTCSKTRHQWVIFLSSKTKPTKSKQTKSKPVALRIHLVLDDSTSMNWYNSRQNLAKALNDFLVGRPNSDKVSIHTLNGSVQTPMVSATDALYEFNEKYKAEGNTPIGRTLSNLRNTHSGDVIILFSDGGPTDGDKPKGSLSIAEAAKLKGKGLRFITIGCGKQAKSDYMSQLASSSSDYYHAQDSTKIMNTFQAVSTSLRQTPRVSLESDDKLSGTAAYCVDGKVVSSEHVTQSSSEVPVGFGFPRIEDFVCPSCKSKDRIRCFECSLTSCGGGIKNNQLTCPGCHTVSEIQDAQNIHSTVDAGGKKQ
jgi:uncharacterized protein YegL